MLRSARRTSRLPNPTEFARLWHFTVFFTATSPPQESNRDPGDDEAEVISTKDMLGRQVERDVFPDHARVGDEGSTELARRALIGVRVMEPRDTLAILSLASPRKAPPSLIHCSPGSSINTFMPFDP